jgi:hypothetical protein
MVEGPSKMMPTKCSCGSLVKWAKEADSPFRVDSASDTVALRMNEAEAVALDFCPFCGGGGPEATLDCKCGLLDRWAGLPSSRVVIDPVFREYRIKVAEDDHFFLRQCPGCGGRLPESLRSAAFATPSVQERLRIRRLFENLQSLQEIVQALGEPDEAGEVPPSTQQRARLIGARCPVRYVRYTGLSPGLAVTAVQVEDGSLQVFSYPLPRTHEGPHEGTGIQSAP